jgi:hypothetical protein
MTSLSPARAACGRALGHRPQRRVELAERAARHVVDDHQVRVEGAQGGVDELPAQRGEPPEVAAGSRGL